MKLLIAGFQSRYEQYLPDLPVAHEAEMVFCKRSLSDEVFAAAAPDAEVVCVDSMRPTGSALMDAMPNLKMIHCEGVGFDQVDLEAARKRGIFVCNNPGANAGAVAEQVILLILALMRGLVPGQRSMLEGTSNQVLKQVLTTPMRELGDCRVGLVGFGCIAKAVTQLLHAFGAEVCYNAPHRRSPEEEAQWGVTYLSLEELAASCDIVSLHCPSNASTHHLVDEGFLRRMKPSALLINTARGDVVDSQALRNALEAGSLAGAGLDTLDQEPAPLDHPLIDLPPELRDRVVLSPHIGGLTTAFFRRGHLNMWRDIEKVAAGRRPDNVVNGL